MNNVVRYYNQNRREIFIIIVIILLIIVLLRAVDYKLAQNKKKEVNNEQVNVMTEDINKNDKKSIISGKKNEVSGNEDIKIIKKFIQYCNDGDTQCAYDLLSDDCKKEVFPTIEYFVNNYYNNNFKMSQIANIKNWINTTYKVDLKENNIYTGNTDGASIQDFITVVKQANENKLNINNYIGKQSINKENNIHNMDIKVTEKNIYMSDEVYTFEIKNNNNYKVILDNLDTTDGIYISDENKMKYMAYTHELSKERLTLNSKSVITINIKFANSYISNRKISRVTFSKVIINDDKNNPISITVDL